MVRQSPQLKITERQACMCKGNAGSLPSTQASHAQWSKIQGKWSMMTKIHAIIQQTKRWQGPTEANTLDEVRACSQGTNGLTLHMSCGSAGGIHYFLLI